MEKIKEFAEVTDPDFRSTTFGVLDLSNGSTRSMMLEDFYRDARSIKVNTTVPEDVRGYMEAVKTQFVYGWFYYPFYTFAAFLATTAVEMAFRARFPKKGKDYRGLGSLFKRAVNEGLLQDEKFPSLKHVQATRAMIYGEGEAPDAEPSLDSPKSYTEAVARKMTHFRNVFAHPSGQWILPPGKALDFLVMAAEVINQVWPEKE